MVLLRLLLRGLGVTFIGGSNAVTIAMMVVSFSIIIVNDQEWRGHNCPHK